MRGHYVGFICWEFPSLWEMLERPGFDINLPLGAPFLISSLGYLLKSFPHVDASEGQREFEIRVFPPR